MPRLPVARKDGARSRSKTEVSIDNYGHYLLPYWSPVATPKLCMHQVRLWLCGRLSPRVFSFRSGHPQEREVVLCGRSRSVEVLGTQQDRLYSPCNQVASLVRRSR